MAAGLFIWAKVVMDFIEDGNYKERLSLIPRHLGEGHQIIELLYEQVLDQAFKGRTPGERHRLEAVLAAAVLAYNPLSFKDIKALMNLADDEELIANSCRRLKAVIHVSDVDKTLHVCHKSFADFMVDHDTIMTAKISKYVPNCYERFSLGCLQILNSLLKFNICKLNTSYFPHHVLLDQSSLEDFIPSYLQYASCYWSSHLNEMIMESNGNVMKQLGIFLHEHFLHWLEVVGLIGAADLASHIMNLAAKALQVSDKNYTTSAVHDILIWLKDFKKS